MQKYIENEIQRYQQLSKLWEVLIDTDHPLNKQVKDSLSIQDIHNLAQYLAERRDEGIELLIPKN